jgi:superfamily I DNA/RNA helicase/mRNA-degrading endonuclease RelE of RelBE toxin-antitoxin system
MNFIIADTFQKSLGRLAADEQAVVKQAAFDFQLNPKNPGFSYEDLKRAKDKNMWSFRASADLRIIVHRTAATFTLCYVDHHDKAYAWAERRRLENHPVTGAAQIVEVLERTEEHVRRVVREEVVEPPVFRRFERDYILALGVPAEWLDAVMNASEADLDALLPQLPQEAAERLLELACGNPVPVPVVERSESGFSHPDAQRRFRVVESENELKHALDFPWDQWMVFLHPSQRKVVERRYNGPARVSGAAGTGKTVVAVHRAADLAKRNPTARILITTFSKTLALRLAWQAKLLLGSDSPLFAQIRIEHVHKVARDVVAGNRGDVAIIQGSDAVQLLEDAIRAAGQPPAFSLAFLKAEWDAVIDPAGIDTWEAYRRAARSNRGTPLGARQRLAAWRIFEHALTLMRQRRAFTWDRVCIEAAKLLREAPMFDHVIADEYQDLGPAEMRFLRALVTPGCDDLFLCGDSGQRIYKAPSSWLPLGIDIRGRSTNLKVNYRTTEQIRRFADRIVRSNIDAGAGEPEQRGSVSLLSGPEPELHSAGSVPEEIETVAAWLTALLEEGISPNEIAVFGRTEAILHNRAEKAVKRAGTTFRLLKDDEAVVADAIAVGTMHRAKGLEFRAVAVIGCDASALPLDSVLSGFVDAADRNEFVEQERQLLYVACTRARERLLVTASGRLTTLVAQETG